MTEDTSDQTIVAEETVTEQNPPSILRTSNDGTWEIYRGAWGSYLRPCSDPDANVVITKEHLEHFEIREDIHKIPAELWTRWVRLCFHFVDKVSKELEVSIRFLRSSSDSSKYRIVVPRQKVTMASVRADNFDECIDIETGEEFTSYPPEGWIPVGSSHSHNTMNAFFSSVDDKYELDDPGIHLTVGKIDTKNLKYEIAASVVGSRRRFIVHFGELIDATPLTGITFHEKVLSYVDYATPTYKPYVKPVVPKIGNFIKKLPPAKHTPKKTYNSIDDYYADRYGPHLYDEDYGWEHDNFTQKSNINDPFYWSDGQVTEIPDDDLIVSHDLHQIVDLLDDYFKDNRNDSDALEEMKQQLAAFLIAVELELSQ